MSMFGQIFHKQRRKLLGMAIERSDNRQPGWCLSRHCVVCYMEQGERIGLCLGVKELARSQSQGNAYI